MDNEPQANMGLESGLEVDIASACTDPPTLLPICSMYGIFTNIHPINGPNISKYSIYEKPGLLDIIIIYIELIIDPIKAF